MSPSLNVQGHHTEDACDTCSTVAYPGAGKGMSIAYLQDILAQHGTGSAHMEVGGMVRRHIREKTSLSHQVNEYSSQGLLVPDSIIVPHIRKEIEGLQKNDLWLLDGYPRHAGQIRSYEELMKMLDRLDLILHLQLDPDPRIAREIAEERMASRGEADRRLGKKPRTDDSDPTVRRQRLDEARQLDDVVAHFEERHKVLTIDASQSIADVRWELRDRLLPLMLAARMRS